MRQVYSQSFCVVGDVHIRSSTPRSRKDNYFQSILTKLEEIILNNHVIFFLGDLFDKPVLELSNTIQLIEFLTRWKKEGGRQFFSIVGNHDIYNYNESSLNKTTLGLLNSLELVHVFEEVKVNDCLIVRQPLTPFIAGGKEELTVPSKQDYTQLGILIHSYYNHSTDGYSIPSSFFQDSIYDFVVFGHDHDQYTPQISGKTTVYRPGSLCRLTSHSSQVWKNPTYLQAKEQDGKFVFTEVRLNNVLEAKDAFIEEIHQDEISNKRTGDDLSLSFKNFDQNLSLLGFLHKSGAKQPVIDYIKSVHDRLSLPFS